MKVSIPKAKQPVQDETLLPEPAPLESLVPGAEVPEPQPQPAEATQPTPLEAGELPPILEEAIGSLPKDETPVPVVAEVAPVPSPLPAAPQPQTRKPNLVGVIVAGVGVLALAGLVALRGGQTEPAQAPQTQPSQPSGGQHAAVAPAPAGRWIE